jgi:hypothetical protein
MSEPNRSVRKKKSVNHLRACSGYESRTCSCSICYMKIMGVKSVRLAKSGSRCLEVWPRRYQDRHKLGGLSYRLERKGRRYPTNQKGDCQSRSSPFKSYSSSGGELILVQDQVSGQYVHFNSFARWYRANQSLIDIVLDWKREVATSCIGGEVGFFASSSNIVEESVQKGRCFV